MRIPALRTLPLALLLASLVLPASFVSASAQQSAAATQVDRVPEHADYTSMVQLKATLPGWVTASRDAGAVPESTNIGIAIVIARSPEVEAAYLQRQDDLQNPNSPEYHHWLTPQQIGEQFGPTQHDLDALTGWLLSQGLQVAPVNPSRTMVHASGAAAVVGKAFKTNFRFFTSFNKPHYSAASEPSIPVALSSIIGSIHGMTDIELRPMSHVQPSSKFTRDASGKPQFTASDGTTHYMFPGDFATIFNINPVYTANIKGSGQKVAIIGESTISNSDITEFESISGLSSNTPNTIVVPAASGGTNPGTVSGDEGESDLDLQRVIGVAPSVTADFVISGTGVAPYAGYQGIDVAAEYEINTLKDPVLTLSYGSCEVDAGTTSDNYWGTLFGQAAMEGISVFVSAGDSGAAGCDTAFSTAPATQQLSVNTICANDYTTCVGGTEFNDASNGSTYWSATNGSNEASALSYIPEGAWNESTFSGGTSFVAGTGGGASIYTAKPSYQTGTGVPADGKRDLPDVSFPASGHDGYFGCEADLTFSGGGSADCSKGDGAIFSGTSAAAPGWAGVTALLNEKLGGTGQGNLNTLIYKLANLSSTPFHDATIATSGVTNCAVNTPSICNNSDPGMTSLTSGQAGYDLTTGYDLATGWGSVDVNALLTTAATETTLAATTATLTANPAAPTTAQTVVFTSKVTANSGTPTGTVQFSSNGTKLGAAVTLVNGTATSPAESFPMVGMYTITALYSGSSTYQDAAAPSLTLNVISSGATATTSTLTSTTMTASTSQTVGFTDTVKGTGGTPTGTVQFTLNGTNYGSPVTLSGGVATLAPAVLVAGSDVVKAIYSGDNSFSASTSNSVTVTVSAAATSTAITVSAPETDPNGYLVFSGTVTAATGGGTPTGSLTLYQTMSAGTPGSAITNPIPITNGTLDVAFTGIPAGSYIVYWVYSGDSNYGTSQSSTVTFNVASTFNPTYTLTPTNTTVTATAGSSASNVITVASTNGFVSNVGLTCTAKYTGSSTDTIVEPTCTFSPATINLLNDNNAMVNATSLYETSTVTISTTKPQGHPAAPAVQRQQGNPNVRRMHGLSAAALVGLLLFAFPAVRRRRSWNSLAAVLILSVAAGFVGCGGGGSSTPITVTVSPASASLTQSQTQQFAANVTGTSNTGVTWSLASGSAGTISASGLYTAPSTISGMETVTVIATSSANTMDTGSATITLNPKTLSGSPSGNYTITVTGTGSVTTTFTLTVQ